MQSILDKVRYDALPPEQRRELTVAEWAAHHAAHHMVDAVAEQLPPEMAGYAVDVAIVGLFTGLARILAQHRSNAVGAVQIAALAQLLPREFDAWKAQASEAADVRH